MAGEEASVFALVGVGFGMFHIGNLLNQEDRWLAASKILAFGVGFLLFISALFVGSSFLAGAHQAVVEWCVASVAVSGIWIIFLSSVVWFIRMMEGWIPKKELGYGGMKSSYDKEV